MQVSIAEAAAHLSDLVEAAINSEEVILLNGDRPAIKLMPVESVRRHAPRLNLLQTVQV